MALLARFSIRTDVPVYLVILANGRNPVALVIDVIGTIGRLFRTWAPGAGEAAGDECDRDKGKEPAH